MADEPAIDPSMVPFTCSAAALGRAVGISEQAVNSYARQGVMVRTGRGQFNFLASIAGYCRHLREIAAGKAGGEQVATEAAIARKRLAEAQAVKVERAHTGASHL
jgi:phage terminase Nu1 subunit (DNA packaging protein)